MSRLQRKLGRAVRRLRTEAGFSQEAFAYHAGLHRTTASKIERGLMNVSLELIERLAKALGMAVSALLAEAEREGARRGPGVGEAGHGVPPRP